MEVREGAQLGASRMIGWDKGDTVQIVRGVGEPMVFGVEDSSILSHTVHFSIMNSTSKTEPLLPINCGA